jgi:hypothetical protein
VLATAPIETLRTLPRTIRFTDLDLVSRRPSKWLIARVMLVLLLSSLPILGISADVFGLVSQRATMVAIIALTAVLAAIVAFAPHRIDVIVGRGLVAGMVACAIYDAFRLFAVHVLGWMGDFIPVMGSWVTGEPNTAGSAAVGYVWRYIGDGGGLGVAFFVIAMAVGLDRWTNRPHRVVLAAVGFAVFPVWAGLIATVAVAPRGEELMFHLTPTTIATTLIGHVIFGLVLGLAFVRAQRGGGHDQWPWPPFRLGSAYPFDGTSVEFRLAANLSGAWPK